MCRCPASRGRGRTPASACGRRARVGGSRCLLGDGFGFGRFRCDRLRVRPATRPEEDAEQHERGPGRDRDDGTTTPIELLFCTSGIADAGRGGSGRLRVDGGVATRATPARNVCALGSSSAVHVSPPSVDFTMVCCAMAYTVWSDPNAGENWIGADVGFVKSEISRLLRLRSRPTCRKVLPPSVDLYRP